MIYFFVEYATKEYKTAVLCTIKKDTSRQKALRYPRLIQLRSDLIFNGKPRKLNGGRGRNDVLGRNRGQLNFGRFINHFHCSPFFDQFFAA